jgi:hypothetical protein
MLRSCPNTELLVLSLQINGLDAELQLFGSACSKIYHGEETFW